VITMVLGVNFKAVKFWALGSKSAMI
jgi:hypothetical protein